MSEEKHQPKEVKAHQLAQLLLDLPSDTLILIPGYERDYDPVPAEDIKQTQAVPADSFHWWNGKYRQSKEGDIPAIILGRHATERENERANFGIAKQQEQQDGR